MKRMIQCYSLMDFCVKQGLSCRGNVHVPAETKKSLIPFLSFLSLLQMEKSLLDYDQSLEELNRQKQHLQLVMQKMGEEWAER